MNDRFVWYNSNLSNADTQIHTDCVFLLQQYQQQQQSQQQNRIRWQVISEHLNGMHEYNEICILA